MSWKWPCLFVVLMGCSEGDELAAPMIGDCPRCGEAPVSGGGSSEAPDGGIADTGNSNGGDVAIPDALDIVDVGAGFVDVP